MLDTEAIAALREAGQAALAGEPSSIWMRRSLREFANAHACQNIVAVSESEARKLRDLGFGNVTVIGHMRALHPTPRPFARRAGMLFVGAIHRMDSPNYDSLCWMVDEVLPLVEKELGWETRLTVVGYTAPEVSLERFRDHPRVTLRGALADTEPVYDSHRVFVAPTRIAAGTPYKVYEAASFGLPVVATELLRRQLDWEDGDGTAGRRYGGPGVVRPPDRAAVSRRGVVDATARCGAGATAAGEQPRGLCRGGGVGAWAGSAL